MPEHRRLRRAISRNIRIARSEPLPDDVNFAGASEEESKLQNLPERGYRYIPGVFQYVFEVAARPSFSPHCATRRAVSQIQPRRGPFRGGRAASDRVLRVRASQRRSTSRVAIAAWGQSRVLAET